MQTVGDPRRQRKRQLGSVGKAPDTWPAALVMFAPIPLRIALVVVAVASCNLPAPSGTAVHLQNGAVRVSDQGSLAGQTPCSTGAGGLDRWCAFFKQAQSSTRGQDVWAIDVSRIGRGEDVQCNASGPACVLVAAGDHVVHAGFVGDTLIVDAVPAGGGVRMLTPVVAWRPDWDQPQTLTEQPASACWSDDVTQAIACLEGDGDQGVAADGGADVTPVDAASTSAGVFRAGRLSRQQRSLVVVPQGRAMAQALPASDRLLVLLASGVAALDLGSGQVTTLSGLPSGGFAVTPDEHWSLSFINQKTDPAGTHSLVASPFPGGGPHHVLLPEVSRHAFAEGPRATGSDVMAVAAAADGTSHLVLAGPDASGAAVTRDLGAWAGAGAGKLDATSAGGYAVVADTQGTLVLSLLGSGMPCALRGGVFPAAQVLTAPAVDQVLWVAAAAGSAGPGYRSSLATCAAGTSFSASATALQLDGSARLLFLDAQKHLLGLDLTMPAAVASSMRDQDEVVYRWAYVAADDVLMLEMTSIFDTETRLYALRQPFATP